MTRHSAFLAFGSKRMDQSETLIRAANSISEEHDIDIVPWTDLDIGGTIMVNRICGAIAKSDLFICDLTYLNHNVLFELGYAIGQRKRIWVLLNNSIDDAAIGYRRFSVLSTLGYVPYQNSKHVVQQFSASLPHLTPYTFFSEQIEQQLVATEQSLRTTDIRALLYLQSPTSTDASMALSRELFHSKLSYWLDDPAEVPMQSLSWYAKHVFNSHGLITHFLSPEHTGWELNNAKMTLVSGLAHGFSKKVLMLAHGPYESVPLDYQDMLSVHDTAQQCELTAKAWIDQFRDPLLEEVTVAKRRRSLASASGNLQRISLGEYVSENEPDNLAEYFVETSEFSEALRSKHSVIVGRKGAGKTANLLMLRNRLQEDKRNHVCVIKPVSYEFQGLVRLLEKTENQAESSYLFESLWKFLIYSELAASVYDAIQTRPPHIGLEDNEAKFKEYIESSSDIFLDSFSLRLEQAVQRLYDMDNLDSAPDQRRRISELLHEEVLSEARKHLGKILTKKERVVVLIDNLDKAWVRGPTLDVLGAALFRLLSVSQSITRDFDRADHWREPVNLSVIIFMRSDIFNYIHRSAREPDKITPKVLRWDDKELLLRVVEERFLRSLPQLSDYSALWEEFFPASVGGMPARDYIAEAVLPRPRDLILFIKEALGNAVNRRHSAITEEDILGAEMRYSQHAFDSLAVEASSQLEHIEAVLLEFAGLNAVLETTEVAQAIRRGGIEDSRLALYIDMLVNLSFLGVETSAGDFVFFSDHNDVEREKTFTLAKRFLETSGRPQRFTVNRPFWSFLELKHDEALSRVSASA